MQLRVFGRQSTDVGAADRDVLGSHYSPTVVTGIFSLKMRIQWIQTWRCERQAEPTSPLHLYYFTHVNTGVTNLWPDTAPILYYTLNFTPTVSSSPTSRVA